MFTGPVGPVEVFFYWPKAIFGNFYWPGAIGSPLAPSSELSVKFFSRYCFIFKIFSNSLDLQVHMDVNGFELIYDRSRSICI